MKKPRSFQTTYEELKPISKEGVVKAFQSFQASLLRGEKEKSLVVNTEIRRGLRRLYCELVRQGFEFPDYPPFDRK
ncbi:MAG TPA: hypothetical protein PL110_07155 [Candidatus Eremiobacteraeota bacterium]|nr:hypothetical protein [Candidatus Eremiobacteraeota bacterium]